MKIKYLPNTFDTRQELEAFLTEWNNSSLSIRQFTSGSTGKPKEIQISKNKMKESAKMTIDFFQLEEHRRFLLCISPKYIGGKMLIIRALETNGALIVAPVSANPLMDLNQEVDFSAFTPYQLERILKENPEQLNLLKNVIVGGAPVSTELEKSLAFYPGNFYSTFGMTETVSHIALRKLNGTNEPYTTIGDSTISLSPQQTLVIHSKRLELDHLVTNDSVEILNNKKFYWLGRSDFAINSGGIKLHPEHIEKQIITSFPGAQVIISSLPHTELGEQLIAITTSPTLYENYKQLDIFLEKYERPKQWFLLDSFIYTPSGKIDRIKTRNLIRFD